MNSNQTLLEIEKVKTKIEESLKRYGEYSTELIELYEEIADLYCSLNEFEECKKYLLKVLEIKRHFYGETNIALIKTYDQLATVSDDKDEIVFYFNEVLRIKKLLYGEKHIETANTYVELANVYAYVTEFELAEKYYLIAVDIYSIKDDCGRELMGCYNELASIYWELTNYEEALKYGKKAYNKAIINNILKPLGDKVKVTIDDEVVFDGKALLMAFGNGNFYGGGYNCTPCADVSDGLIDYQIVKKVSVLTFATLIGKYKKGLIFGNPKYKRIAKSGKAKKIIVESPNTLTICIDGETIHRNKVTIEILKHKIRFILPKK